MADQYGELEIPIELPGPGDAVADRALTILLRYLQDFLNANCRAAWQSVVPSTDPVRDVAFFDPTLYVLNPQDLPVLYGWRAGVEDRADSGQRFSQFSADQRVADGTVKLLWLFPPPEVEHLRLRDTFLNGLLKAIDRAIRLVRDPSFVVKDDPDPKAATLPPLPEAIKQSIATSASPATYEDDDLDGSIGGATFAPARPFLLTCAGDPASFTNGAVVVATGRNALGYAATASVTLDTDRMPGTFTSSEELVSFSRIDVPEMVDSGAAMSFGLGPFTGRGSVVMRHAGLERLRIQSGGARLVPIQHGDGQPIRAYDALAVTLETRELTTEDPSRFAVSGLDLSILSSGGSDLGTATLPEDG